MRIGTKADGAMVEGEYLVRALDHTDLQGMKAPSASRLTKDLRAPLCIDTMSGGPRGNVYDGVTSRVSFRSPVTAKKASCDVGQARTKKGLPEFATS